MIKITMRALIFLLINAASVLCFGAEHNFNSSYATPGQNFQNILSPRMDFDQWKPLTGRGDPLRNDPTYDYEPPMLDKVHYWIDPVRKAEKVKKSDVLLLGISSKKPSIPQPIKRDSMETFQKLMSSLVFPHNSRPNTPMRQRPMSSHISFPSISSNKVKYEDYSYKYSQNNVPMTILVPPPPPPTVPATSITTESYKGEDLLNFDEDINTDTINHENSEQESALETTEATQSSSSFVVQESNLIYHSSSTNLDDKNEETVKKPFEEVTIRSDYAGWGPTSNPPLSDVYNFDQNLLNSSFEIDNLHNTYYSSSFSETQSTSPFIITSHEPTTQTTTTEKPQPNRDLKHSEAYNFNNINPISVNSSTAVFNSTRSVSTTLKPRTVTTQKNPSTTVNKQKQGSNYYAMLRPMFEMPLSLPYKAEEEKISAQNNELKSEIEMMQTMQPPPISITTEKSVTFPHITSTVTRPVSKFRYSITRLPLHVTAKVPTTSTTTTTTTTQSPPQSMNADYEPIFASYIEPKPTVNQGPSYVIIQGHSKVKTYGPKNKTPTVSKITDIDNTHTQEAQQVRHLHTYKEKDQVKKNEKKKAEYVRDGKTLKQVVSNGDGKIDIAETSLGIQLDISDGSEVPAEIYKKGFVETELADLSALENKYNTTTSGTRVKRQLGLENILTIDPETIDEYIYNYLKEKSKQNSLTGYIASAVTSEAAEVLDDIEEEVPIR